MARKKARSKPKRETDKSESIESGGSADGAKKRSLWRRVVKFLPLLALTLLFTFFFQRSGLFAELETKILDAKMQLDMPETESDVVVVDITQDDFDQLFLGRTRPLNPPVLQNLIEAIAKGGPCVIGVDIDTSFAEFGKLENFEAAQNVVWLREAKVSDIPGEEPVAEDVLGGRYLELYEKSGLPLLIPDKIDKEVTRRYSRRIRTAQGDLRSLPWAVFTEAKVRNCPNIDFPDLEENTDEIIIGYSRGADGAGRLKIPAANVLKLSKNPNWQTNDLIRNKIVLVGGSYLGEDRHETPLGKMSGVQIIANVLETELRGDGLKPPGFFSIVLLQIFDGVLLLALFQIFSWRKALLLTLPAIAVISLACSFLTYYSFSHWIFFAPVMVGVVLIELGDKAKDYFKNRYKAEITETFGSPGAIRQKSR